MNEKLKPCPFCGGEAHLINNNDYMTAHKPNDIYYVMCLNCRAKTNFFYTDDEQEAINAWNTRVKE